MIYSILKQVPKGWNPTAKDCFKINCKCENCFIHKVYFSNSILTCKMKYYVIEMYKRFGKPEDEKI